MEDPIIDPVTSPSSTPLEPMYVAVSMAPTLEKPAPVPMKDYVNTMESMFGPMPVLRGPTDITDGVWAAVDNAYMNRYLNKKPTQKSRISICTVVMLIMILGLAIAGMVLVAQCYSLGQRIKVLEQSILPPPASKWHAEQLQWSDIKM